METVHLRLFSPVENLGDFVLESVRTLLPKNFVTLEAQTFTRQSEWVNSINSVLKSKVECFIGGIDLYPFSVYFVVFGAVPEEMKSSLEKHKLGLEDVLGKLEVILKKSEQEISSLEIVSAERSVGLTEKQRKSREAFLKFNADLCTQEEAKFWREWIKDKELGQRTISPHPEIPEWNPNPSDIPDWNTTSHLLF